jgi:hypothetical protein
VERLGTGGLYLRAISRRNSPEATAQYLPPAKVQDVLAESRVLRAQSELLCAWLREWARVSAEVMPELRAVLARWRRD